MKIQQFGFILKKIKSIPISDNDVSDNILLVHKGRIDLNYHDHIVHNDYPHFYYEPGKWKDMMKAVKEHNNRVDNWNKNHPYQEVKIFSVLKVLPYPVLIGGIIVSDKELFKFLHNDIDIFVKTFNKSILIYFKNKLEIAKNLEVNFSATEKYKGHIRAVNKWFLDNDINTDETESFFDENQLSFEKTNKNEKNHEQEKKQPVIDFKKLIPQDIQWKQIKINILDEDSIKIKYPGGSFDIRFSQTQNFVNKTTKKCNNSWKLLLELSLIGCFQPNNHTYKLLSKKTGKAKNRVYTLGKAMMNEFDIKEKPFFPYNSQEGWFPKFTIRDLRKNIIRTNAQAEIYKSQQTVKRKQYQDSPPKIGDTYSSDDYDSYANEQKDHKDKLDYKDEGFHRIAKDEL